MRPLLAFDDWAPFPTSSRLASAIATLAQSVEQLPRKEQVDGSIPSGGSTRAQHFTGEATIPSNNEGDKNEQLKPAIKPAISGT